MREVIVSLKTKNAAKTESVQGIRQQEELKRGMQIVVYLMESAW